MKIGIVEIMPIGHYTLVDSLVRIFASDKNNYIYLFIHKNGKTNVKPLVKLFADQLSFFTWDGESNLETFFELINQTSLDKFYMVTFEKYFKEYYYFNFNSEANVFIHNVDEWFYVNLKYILYHLLRNLSSFNDFIYRIKVNIIYTIFRKKIIKKNIKTGGRFLVLNSFLKEELLKFLPEDKIDTIPFSVYDPSRVDQSQNNKMLRVCIPGMVSETRRDYYAIINLINENLDLFSKKIEIDFLGGIANKEGGQKVLSEIIKLSDRGAKIIYYNKLLVSVNEFDEQLTSADLILGNIKINVDKYSTYGKTKETGIPFTMIRAAKPGILPAGYNVLKEIESSTIRFTEYDELKDILLDLVNNRNKLLMLKQEAIKNSLKFEPSKIYHELMLQRS